MSSEDCWILWKKKENGKWVYFSHLHEDYETARDILHRFHQKNWFPFLMTYEEKPFSNRQE